MSVQERLYTARDLADMPDDGKIYELHNGVLVEAPGSKYRQTRLAAWIIYLLTAFIEQNKLGGSVTSSDGTCVLTSFNTRIPDAACISAEAHQRQDDNSFVEGAPDLAVEVVSPSNSAPEMQRRAGEYLSAGTRLVWIVNPDQKTVDVYRADGSRIVVSGDNGILEGYDVLPGLKLALSRVFERV